MPKRDKILVTGNKYENDQYEKGLIVASKGDLKTNQVVIAVGSFVRDIKPGDKVVFNPLHYAKWKIDPNSVKKEMALDDKVIEWNLPWVTIENEEGDPAEYLLLTENDVEYVYEGYEKDDVIYTPPKKKILLN